MSIPGRLCSLVAGLAAALLLALPAAAKPPVWVVRDADSEIVLFGSVHVLPAGLDWRPAKLDAALTRADDIWFELPIAPETEAESGRLAAALGRLPEGRSLSALLSVAGRERLARACAQYGLSPVLMDRLEPWFAEVVLASAQYRVEGAQSDAGVEKVIAAAAPTGVRQEAFETAEAQIRMFDAAPMPAQVASLEQTLKELETDPDAYDRLVQVWMKGDTRAIERLALDPIRRATPEIFNTLVRNRNLAWTETLTQRLAGRGRTVVVVGVGHLVGKGGVPARLRALGYSVEGP